LPGREREAKLEAYPQQATKFGSVAREHGALRYREFPADDVDEKLAVEAGQLADGGRGRVPLARAPMTRSWRRS